MNKKALAMKTLVELIFFAVITLLIALPLVMKMLGFFIEEPESGTQKSLDALAIEINNIYGDKTVPVYVDEDHFIRGYKADEPKPGGRGCAEDESCLCICNIRNINEEECGMEGRKIQCKRLEFNLGNDVVIEPKLVDDEGETGRGDPTIQNCLLSMDDNLVTVSCS